MPCWHDCLSHRHHQDEEDLGPQLATCALSCAGDASVAVGIDALSDVAADAWSWHALTPLRENWVL